MHGLNDIGINNVPGSSNAISKMSQGYFPDPWCDVASTEMPRSLSNVLEWAEFVWLTNGTYRMACERVVSYFITKLEISDADDDIAKKYQEFFADSISYVDTLRLLGNDFMCYGNSFSSLFLPFNRFLRCDKCKLERPIDKVKYDWTKDFEFHGVCPSCGNNGAFERVDRKSSSKSEMRLLRWSPHRMVIQFNTMTGDYEYRLRIHESWKKKIKEGDEFYLRTTPWEFIQTIKEDKLFRFSDGAIFHMKEQTLGGVTSVGWGIPRFISNFKQAYYIQVLKRYNEALALDYIVPFRVITPRPGTSQIADPLIHQDLGRNKQQVMSMVKEHRKDPATWHYLPFPVDYQALGGEGLQMGGHELINVATDEMLNAQGIPAELYKGTLQVQAAPLALRLFQQTWPHLVAQYNDWLKWAADKVASTENWEPIDVKLQPVTLADDLEKKQLLLQMASANVVSRQTALSPLGVDVRDEVQRIYDEQRYQSEKEREFQNEEAERAKMEEALAAAEQQAAAGQMPGGMPGAAGGAVSPPMAGGITQQPPGGAAGTQTPQDMMIQAEQQAKQLIQMPYEERRRMLSDIKEHNEALHALVTQKMEDLRREARYQGGQMVMSGQM